MFGNEFELLPSLHEAAAQGKLDIVDYYISIGVDVNDMSIKVTSSGKKWSYSGNPERGLMTPLHLASLNNQTAVVELLITKGKANPEIRDQPRVYGGATALQIAISRKHRDTALMLIKLGADTSSIDAKAFLREISIRQTMSAVKEEFRTYLKRNDFPRGKDYLLTPQEEINRLDFLSGKQIRVSQKRGFSMSYDYDSFYDHLTTALVKLQKDDLTIIGTGKESFAFHYFAQCYEMLEYAGYPIVREKPIHFWNGQLGKEKAKETSCLAYSDSSIPSTHIMFKLSQMIDNQEELSGQQPYLFRMAGNINSAIFALQARGVVDVFLSSDKPSEKPGLTVGNHFWEYEFPVLENLRQREIVDQIRFHVFDEGQWKQGDLNDYQFSHLLRLYRRQAYPSISKLADSHPERFQPNHPLIYGTNEFNAWQTSAARPFTTHAKLKKMAKTWRGNVRSSRAFKTQLEREWQLRQLRNLFPYLKWTTEVRRGKNIFSGRHLPIRYIDLPDNSLYNQMDNEAIRNSEIILNTIFTLLKRQYPEINMPQVTSTGWGHITDLTNKNLQLLIENHQKLINIINAVEKYNCGLAFEARPNQALDIIHDLDALNQYEIPRIFYQALNPIKVLSYFGMAAEKCLHELHRCSRIDSLVTKDNIQSLIKNFHHLHKILEAFKYLNESYLTRYLTQDICDVIFDNPTHAVELAKAYYYLSQDLNIRSGVIKRFLNYYPNRALQIYETVEKVLKKADFNYFHNPVAIHMSDIIAVMAHYKGYISDLLCAMQILVSRGEFNKTSFSLLTMDAVNPIHVANKIIQKNDIRVGYFRHSLLFQTNKSSPPHNSIQDEGYFVSPV